MSHTSPCTLHNTKRYSVKLRHVPLRFHVTLIHVTNPNWLLLSWCGYFNHYDTVTSCKRPRTTWQHLTALQVKLRLVSFGVGLAMVTPHTKHHGGTLPNFMAAIGVRRPGGTLAKYLGKSRKHKTRRSWHLTTLVPMQQLRSVWEDFIQTWYLISLRKSA